MNPNDYNLAGEKRLFFGYMKPSSSISVPASDADIHPAPEK
jgi:hypothetical protein